MPRPRSQRPLSVAGVTLSPAVDPPQQQTHAAGAFAAAAAAGGAAGAGLAVVGVADDARRRLAPDSSRFSESFAYGHHSRVFDVALSALGDVVSSYLVASAGEDEVVRVWRRRKKKLTDVDDDVDGDRSEPATTSSTSLSPPPTATTGFDQVAALRGHGEPVLRVSWGPANSRLLASAGGDRAARIWKLEGGGRRGGGDDGDDDYGGDDGDDGDDDYGGAPPPDLRFSQAAVLAGHGEEVYACEFTPDSRCVVTASEDRVYAWDVETGQRWGSYGGRSSDDVQRPPSGVDGDAGGSTPALPARWAAAHVFSATLSPPDAAVGGGGGAVVAAACSDGCLRLWSLRQQRGTAAAPPPPPSSSSSPSSSSPSSSSPSSSSPASLSPVAAIRVHASSPAAACCWSRDGTRVAVTGSRSGGVAVVDVRAMRVCWRGNVRGVEDGRPPSPSAPPFSGSAASAMGACFFEAKEGEGEALAVATGLGRVALFDVDGRGDRLPSPASPPPAERKPSSYLRSRCPPASATRNMLCVAPGPLPGTLSASGDAFVDDGVGGMGGRSDARRSKWSPISFWEEHGAR